MIHGTSKKISFHNSGKSEDIRCRNGVFGSTMDVTVDVYLSLSQLRGTVFDVLGDITKETRCCCCYNLFLILKKKQTYHYLL